MPFSVRLLTAIMAHWLTGVDGEWTGEVSTGSVVCGPRDAALLAVGRVLVMAVECIVTAEQTPFQGSQMENPAGHLSSPRKKLVRSGVIKTLSRIAKMRCVISPPRL